MFRGGGGERERERGGGGEERRDAGRMVAFGHPVCHGRSKQERKEEEEERKGEEDRCKNVQNGKYLNVSLTLRQMIKYNENSGK